MEAINLRSQNFDFFFKMVLVGDIGVGKTSLLRAFTERQFSTRVRPNDIADVEVKDIIRGSKKVRINIWDTAGLERYRSLTESYYRNTKACIVMFDVTNERSFQNAPNWIADCLRYCPPKTQIILVGSKCKECLREVPRHRAESLAFEMEIAYMEVSAQEMYNVDNLFYTVSDMILEDIKSKAKQRAHFIKTHVRLNKNSHQMLAVDFCMKEQCPCG